MTILNLIKPIGILTFILLSLTIFSGLKRWKLKFHRAIAFSTFLLALLHAAIVVYLEHS